MTKCSYKGKKQGRSAEVTLLGRKRAFVIAEGISEALTDLLGCVYLICDNHSICFLFSLRLGLAL
jgi:hypothetical protein